MFVKIEYPDSSGRMELHECKRLRIQPLRIAVDDEVKCDSFYLILDNAEDPVDWIQIERDSETTVYMMNENGRTIDRFDAKDMQVAEIWINQDFVGPLTSVDSDAPVTNVRIYGTPNTDKSIIKIYPDEQPG